MMQRGDWIKIDSMDGEPQMTGKCGQYDHTDSIGQLQGSWGIAINPGTDSYHLMSDAEVKEYLNERLDKYLSDKGVK